MWNAMQDSFPLLAIFSICFILGQKSCLHVGAFSTLLEHTTMIVNEDEL